MSTTIRAKFYCQAAIKDGENEQVDLNAVYDDANKSWSKWTPAGQLRLTINNPDAQGKFKVGKTYFLDITEAPAAEKDEAK